MTFWADRMTDRPCAVCPSSIIERLVVGCFKMLCLSNTDVFLSTKMFCFVSLLVSLVQSSPVRVSQSVIAAKCCCHFTENDTPPATTITTTNVVIFVGVFVLLFLDSHIFHFVYIFRPQNEKEIAIIFDTLQINQSLSARNEIIFLI